MKAYLGIGTNIGNRIENLQNSIDDITDVINVINMNIPITAAINR